MALVKTQLGWIEVICGSMFSGKSEELIRRLRRAIIAKQRVQIFKPRIDSRYADAEIVSHSEMRLPSLSVASSDELLEKLDHRTEVVGVDEAQFFDEGLADLAMSLADAGIRVIIAGLDQDFARRPFGPMPRLLALAEVVDKMHAVCVRCGAPAHYSQRIAGGSSQILVGDADAYEARCRRCYEPYEGA